MVLRDTTAVFPPLHCRDWPPGGSGHFGEATKAVDHMFCRSFHTGHPIAYVIA
nr:MAG TPA: hypothetical protein [Caudoviricetes sp.]